MCALCRAVHTTDQKLAPASAQSPDCRRLAVAAMLAQVRRGSLARAQHRGRFGCCVWQLMLENCTAHWRGECPVIGLAGVCW